MKELNDELLESVCGGKIYHFDHNCNCPYGANCNLIVFPFIAIQGNTKPADLTDKNIGCFCDSLESALQAELALNIENMDPNVINVNVDTSMHISLESQGVCRPVYDIQ